jgi:hypothetical protein
VLVGQMMEQLFYQMMLTLAQLRVLLLTRY